MKKEYIVPQLFAYRMDSPNTLLAGSPIKVRRREPQMSGWVGAKEQNSFDNSDESWAKPSHKSVWDDEDEDY